MAGFKKHDFGFFKSKEELQDTLNRKKAHILHIAAYEKASMNELARTYLKVLLLEAVNLGLNPTFLVKDRLDMLLDDDVDTIFCLVNGVSPEGLTDEEILDMWREEAEALKLLTEEEIYDAISK